MVNLRKDRYKESACWIGQVAVYAFESVTVCCGRHNKHIGSHTGSHFKIFDDNLLWGM